MRTESGVNIQVMIAVLQNERASVRLFGGPTFYRMKAEIVEDIEFSQFATRFSRTNLVEVTGYQAVEAEETGVGFHVGGHASWVFTRVVGFGGSAWFGSGTVELDPETMSQVTQDVKVGGFQAGGGLRLRFGR